MGHRALVRLASQPRQSPVLFFAVEFVANDIVGNDVRCHGSHRCLTQYVLLKYCYSFDVIPQWYFQDDVEDALSSNRFIKTLLNESILREASEQRSMELFVGDLHGFCISIAHLAWFPSPSRLSSTISAG